MSKSKSELNKDYIISYKLLSGNFRIYSETTGEITECDMLPRDIKKFIMLSGDDRHATDDDLREYAIQFREWNRELKFNDICSIEYSECYSDYTVVTRTFNRYCKKNYKNHDTITPVEYKWFERCANSGIQYLKQNNYTKTGYAYDFKSQYGLVMISDNKIPSKEGEEVTLKKLPKRKDLKHGFYHVKITCDNDNFRKMFVFSKYNTYLNVSLEFAMKHKKEFDIKFELVQKNQPNAYLYKDEDMVTLSSITSEWFTKLTNLRKKFPKNRLLKHLISSAWGGLNANNEINKTLDEIKSEKLIVGITDKSDYIIKEYYDYDNRQYYVLLDRKRPYKHNIRLKPWITALARNLTASVVLEDVDSVIRTHTDCIVFKHKMKFDNPNLVPEEKTTGKIHWINAGCYSNLTNGYKSKNYNSSAEILKSK
jgi:hypothetical protein